MSHIGPAMPPAAGVPLPTGFIKIGEPFYKVTLIDPGKTNNDFSSLSTAEWGPIQDKIQNAIKSATDTAPSGCEDSLWTKLTTKKATLKQIDTSHIDYTDHSSGTDIDTKVALTAAQTRLFEGVFTIAQNAVAAHSPPPEEAGEGGIAFHPVDRLQSLHLEASVEANRIYDKIATNIFSATAEEDGTLSHAHVTTTMNQFVRPFLSVFSSTTEREVYVNTFVEQLRVKYQADTGRHAENFQSKMESFLEQCKSLLLVPPAAPSRSRSGDLSAAGFSGSPSVSDAGSVGRDSDYAETESIYSEDAGGAADTASDASSEVGDDEPASAAPIDPRRFSAPGSYAGDDEGLSEAYSALSSKATDDDWEDFDSAGSDPFSSRSRGSVDSRSLMDEEDWADY